MDFLQNAQESLLLWKICRWADEPERPLPIILVCLVTGSWRDSQQDCCIEKHPLAGWREMRGQETGVKKEKKKPGWHKGLNPKFSDHFPQPRQALLEALQGVYWLYSGNLAMGPFLFYFRPENISEDIARSPILYQKWQTYLSSRLISDLLTVSVSSAMLKRI